MRISELAWERGERAEARAALLADCEEWRMEATFGGLEAALAVCAPALIELPDGSGWLAVAQSKKRSLLAFCPDRVYRRIGMAELCALLREPVERGRRAEVEGVLAEAGVGAGRRERAARAILREYTANRRWEGGWSLRVPAGASTGRWLGQVDAARNGAALTGAHLAQYAIWLASFFVIGQSALAGRMDRGWLEAWALLLLSLIPFRLLTAWLQGLIAIGVGGLLKQRLLAGTLKLSPDEIRHQGIGQFLGQALEAETVETLAINGGIAGLLAVLELAVAGVVMGPSWWLLAVWFGITVGLGWRFLRRYETWTRARMAMTHGLVEKMVGHRTRLAQLARGEWHEAEDREVEGYLGVSRALDGAGAALIAGVPRGWLLVGIGAVAPGFVGGTATAPGLAVALGGAMLAYTAFRRLTGSMADLAAAWVAWGQVSGLFRAASRRETAGVEGLAVEADRAGKLEADGVTFRYRAGGEPVLRGCSLSIRAGDRVLLEGPSGEGKSTLASILSGLRRPEAGVLLSGGLDLETLGLDRWRKRVASAPQFHENHVFTETLAFNLLMGRAWPPTPDDMAEAEAVCGELGLGGLLERMPGGLLQMVGEGGWQLSHGERSRVFMARALLQKSEMVVLDESFAALDPESLKVALECALARAGTLVVIAHP